MRSSSYVFWCRWLLVASTLLIVFGAALVVAPTWAKQGFALLIFGEASAIDALGVEAARYASLANAVIGAVMMGWGCTMVYLTRCIRDQRSRIAWNVVALSLVVWFVPDTTYSLTSGYWPNAALNAGFALLFAVPLMALRRGLDVRC